MKEIPISEYNWTEFKQFCYEQQFKQGTLFRGQSNSNWKLVPSCARHKYGADFRKYIERILPEAKRYVAGYVDYDFDLTSDDDRNRLMGLLQHHGFPTPLLDWTISPYIAAYFAFADYAFSMPGSDYVAVWLLNAEYSIEFFEENQGGCPFDIVMPDSRFNKRLLAQDGIFTLSLSPLPLDEELLRTMKKHDHLGLLQKIVLPVEASRLALKDLSLMGLHPGTLFPGLDGTCEMLKMKLLTDSEMLMSPRGKRLVASMLEGLKKGNGNNR